MGTFVIDKLIINSPYEEPKHYWKYNDGTKLFELTEGRRPAGYITASGIEKNRSFEDPGEFHEIGLVNQVFPADQLLDAAKKFAKKLAGMPGFAIKMAKHSINYGYDLSLDNANRLETECCAQCFSTDDQKEGMAAFLEKRKPNFKGQ